MFSVVVMYGPGVPRYQLVGCNLFICKSLKHTQGGTVTWKGSFKTAITYHDGHNLLSLSLYSGDSFQDSRVIDLSHVSRLNFNLKSYQLLFNAILGGCEHHLGPQAGCVRSPEEGKKENER